MDGEVSSFHSGASLHVGGNQYLKMREMNRHEEHGRRRLEAAPTPSLSKPHKEEPIRNGCTLAESPEDQIPMHEVC